MFDVVALGELLIDFTFAGTSEGGQRLFEQNPGGAPGNFLTVISHMGLNGSMIGKVGDDMHGKFLIETLKKQNINTDNMIIDKDYFTTLAFVSINADGEREFSFARKPGADIMLKEEELNEEALKNTKVFHLGSLSLTSEPAKSASYAAVKIAKDAGAVISYDPNYRASLWPDEATAVKEMKAMFKNADLVKVSDEEAILITGEKDFSKAADILMAEGPSVIAITLGGDGVFVKTKDGEATVAGFKVNAVDTTGAGDSFWGGFVSQFIVSGKKLDELTVEDVKKFALFGNATASLCVQKRGGIPAIPYKADVEDVLN